MMNRLFKKKEEEAAENGEEVTANQVDEIIETTAEPEVLVVEDGIETTDDLAGTLETTYGALPVDSGDSFTSINIPFVANAPFAASRSIPFGASTQGFTSRFSPRGVTSGYTSGYSGFGATTGGVTSGYTSGYSGFGANTQGFTSTVASSNASSYTIPFKANTPSYSGFGTSTQGFTSTVASSNASSYTIPFKANTPSYSASPVTSAYSTTPTTTLGSSYAAPMKTSGPPVGNGAGASAFRNITSQRDSQLQTSINNATTLRP
jgi:hypothetical protein